MWHRIVLVLLSIFLVTGSLTEPVVPEEVKPAALTYSAWTKFCLNDMCFIGKDGRTDCGPIVAATLVERKAETKTTLRVTLPARVNIDRGVRIQIDQSQPISLQFVQCFPNGCMADYEAGPELIDQLKQGHMLLLEGEDRANSVITLNVPLDGFGSAYDGPAAEVHVFEEQLSKEEMQAYLEREKRAEEERKSRCEGKQ
jgi:invasion protein IalB